MQLFGEFEMGWYPTRTQAAAPQLCSLIDKQLRALPSCSLDLLHRFLALGAMIAGRCWIGCLTEYLAPKMV